MNFQKMLPSADDRVEARAIIRNFFKQLLTLSAFFLVVVFFVIFPWVLGYLIAFIISAVAFMFLWTAFAPVQKTKSDKQETPLDELTKQAQELDMGYGDHND